MAVQPPTVKERARACCTWMTACQPARLINPGGANWAVAIAPKYANGARPRQLTPSLSQALRTRTLSVRP
eukprot:364514-Chlamydomonas_euryale.AAC.6